MAIVYLALGSNLGDRLEFITQAVALLGEDGVRLARLSTVIETDPVGGPAEQGDFLNAVMEGRTELSPQDLHLITQSIENKLGRKRKIFNGPRTIDIDILLYDDIKFVSRKLIIPHPRMIERDFVMDPLKEIAPRTYQELMNARC